jgi:hypothetical protein
MAIDFKNRSATGAGAGAGTAAAPARTPQRGAAPAAGAVVSLNPDSFISTGLINDTDVEILEASFVEWDYDGKSERGPSLFLRLTLHPLDPQVVEQFGEEVLQYYSAGDLSRFQPSPDGKSVVQVGGASAMSNSTNMAEFLRSLISSGLPSDQLTGSSSVLEGMTCHVIRVPQQKRAGLAAREGQTDRVPEILVVDKIISMRGEARPVAGGKALYKGVAAQAPVKGLAKAAAPASRNVPVPTAAAARANGETGAAGGDPTEQAVQILQAMLAENNGSLPKPMLAAKSFKHVSRNPNRQDIIDLFKNDEFLEMGNAEGWWAFDGTTIQGAA